MRTQDLKTTPGNPLPFGASRHAEGINFALYARHATSVTLILYDINNQLFMEIDLDPKINQTGDVWHIFLITDLHGALGYGYKINGSTKDPRLQYFDRSKTLLDPYAKAVLSPIQWGTLSDGDKASYNPLGLVLPSTDFDWENDKPLQIPEKDLIIYEMHVRGFTRHPSSRVKTPGTFLGVIEKIPHLQELGINAVELMPLQEFNECEYKVPDPLIKEKLYQYWGYSTVNFFAPMNRYASNSHPGAAIHEFKSMVKALHKNGIAVILDVVFNHTCEGDEKEPTNSFKGIDPMTYYLMDEQGGFLNFTGCGNTVNTNQPIVQKFIVDVLHYWVLEMHVDGFRFDLASIFNRGTHGEVLSKAPIIEVLSHDPILAKTLLIAEPWDAVGLYQVGGFHPSKIRWSEWNARYRDTIRRFIKGNSDLKGKFASRLSGSQDIYYSRSPLSSINFVVAHDGFTLNDLVTYNEKHNLSNGENNNDGANNNDSWNCGKEGLVDNPAINELRARQMRNFHLALMLSQGIPMLLMGDEYGHTKKGNNNSWCHDNELNWFLWDQLQENSSFYRYYRKLIEFRKQHPILHREDFLADSDVSWLGINAQMIEWNKDTQLLAFTLSNRETGTEIYCAFNAQDRFVDITIPTSMDGQKWHLVANTANASPEDFYDVGERPLIEQKQFPMVPFSALLLESQFYTSL